MTVCVAALCKEADGRSTVFGASDRMMTAGDVQFEPYQWKAWMLTNSVVALLAGDAALQAEIMLNVDRDVKLRVAEEPERWWTVEEAAYLCSRYYTEVKKRRAESKVLGPLGLDAGTFATKPLGMPDVVVREIASDMVNFEIPGVETIVLGIDPTPQYAHIWTVIDGSVECADTIGFAAIGYGHSHASSQFMVAKHTKHSPSPDTLYLTYSAKRRAEVAPFVGQGTDMFSVGPDLASFRPIEPEILNELKKIYETARQDEARAFARAKKKINEHLERLSATKIPRVQEPPAEVPAPTDPADGAPATKKEGGES